MAKVLYRPSTIGVLVSTLSAGIAISGCAASRTSGPTGAGGGTTKDGSMQGSGGTAGASFTIAGGGNTGTGGIGSGWIAGGLGTGGVASGGIDGKATGGTASGGVAAGGIGAGGVVSGGAGGRATGGSGAGGTGTGGMNSLDAGACIGGACSTDAEVIDSGTGDTPVFACAQVTTQSDCETHSNCHTVFVDPGTCTCSASGCCARFDRCADGAQANCTGPATCTLATPHCESPYAVEFTGACYGGCVRQTACAPPTCPRAAPTSGSNCGSVDHSCTYEDCANSGRTQAACTNGTWTIQTLACSSQACAGAGINAMTITCPAGKLCVRTTSGGGAYLVYPSCVDNTCGTGPISPACVQGLSDNCSSTGSAVSGVQINCSLPSSCGQGQGGCA